MTFLAKTKSSTTCSSTVKSLKFSALTNPQSTNISLHQLFPFKQQRKQIFSCSTQWKGFKNCTVSSSKSQAISRINPNSNLSNKELMRQEKPFQKLRKIVERKIPEDLKIIYYGPIKKEESCILKGRIFLQSQRKEEEICRQGLKSLEKSSFRKEINSKNRYYDLDTTVESSNDPLNLTYYQMGQIQDDKQEKQKQNSENSIHIYFLIALVGVILLLKASLI